MRPILECGFPCSPVTARSTNRRVLSRLHGFGVGVHPRRPGGSSVNDAPRNASADASRRPDATTAEYSPLDLVKRNQSAPRQVTELTEHRGSPPLPDTARRGAPGSQKDPQRRAAISTTAFRNNANGAPIRSPAYPVATRHNCLSLPWFYLERLSSCART